MSDDKHIDLEGVAEDSNKEQSLTPNSATRARNRTVMLTPEVTGEVRAKLARETEEHNSAKSADHDFVPYHQITASGAGENVGSKKTSLPDSETEAFQGAVAGVRNSPQEKSHTSELGPVDLRGSAILLNSDKNTKLLGFLVAFDANPNGEYFELRVGRIIVSSERAGAGTQLVMSHPSVSPMHAVLKIVDGGEVQVLDQLSEKGTKIVRAASGAEELLCGDKTTIGNGDKVYFGDREFFVCLINQRRVGKDDRSKSN